MSISHDGDYYGEANAAASSIARRLKDLRNYQLPRLKDSRDASLQADVAAEMKDDLELTMRTIENFTELAFDQDTPADREGFLARAEAFKQETNDIRLLYRKALLFSSKEIKKATRTSLLQPRVVESTIAETPAEARRDDDDPLQAKTNEVTDALRRTVGTMKEELERSVMVTQMFDESTQTLRSTSSLYDRSTNLLKSSSHLVKHLEKADWYDRMIIFLALGFFFLVIAFILKRRVLDKVAGGVWWWVGGTFKILTGRGRSKTKLKLKPKDVGKVVDQATKVGSTIKGAVRSLSENLAQSETIKTMTLTETRVLTSTAVAGTRHVEL